MITLDMIFKGIFFTIVILFISLYGLLSLHIGREKYKEACESSKYWAKTEGKIISSEIKRKTFGFVSSPNEDSFAPKIEYAYTINGKTFRGNRINFGYESASRIFAIITTKIKYPDGKSIMVYYNQNNPIESVLNPTVLHTYGYFIAGIGSFIVNLFIIKGLIDGTI